MKLKNSTNGKPAVSARYFRKQDINQFKQGNHFELYQKLGAHCGNYRGKKGTYFATWAPEAKSVSVIGDFNQWKPARHPLVRRDDQSGIWEGFIPGVKKGALYKYHVVGCKKRKGIAKSDPFGFCHEAPSKSASVIWDLKYSWKDKQWMNNLPNHGYAHCPVSIYEVHLGSWKQAYPLNGRYQSYKELADTLVDYVKDMNFTHVELLPIMEHPYYASWGYQPLGYFAPTARYGTPQELMYLIDKFHQNGIGVILDWVPSHFPSDEHGLAEFDGTNLFEDGECHPEWTSCIFNLGKMEVIEFLVSNALFWLDKYHIDGLRVDAVASMLYLDYSREDGQWLPNFFGGKENIESVAFLRRLNEAIKEKFPKALIIAEESSAWPNVSRPTDKGGLNFDMKWNMGWMHDTLDYFKKPPLMRKKFQDNLTFSLCYAFTENYILSLSHDEVVHEKSSLIGKMPGKPKEKFSHLKCLYGYMYAHPGKKLLFMGSELAQWNEWNHDDYLRWNLLKYSQHQGIQQWVKDLNRLYKRSRALHEQDFCLEGFQWLDIGWTKKGLFSFLRKGVKRKDVILIVCNFTKSSIKNYKVGVPFKGEWKEVLNSDSTKYNGQGKICNDDVVAQPNPYHDQEYHLSLNLPPLSVLFYTLGKYKALESAKNCVNGYR